MGSWCPPDPSGRQRVEEKGEPALTARQRGIPSGSGETLPGSGLTSQEGSNSSLRPGQRVRPIECPLRVVQVMAWPGMMGQGDLGTPAAQLYFQHALPRMASVAGSLTVLRWRR